MLDCYNFNRTIKLNLKTPHLHRGLELIKFMFLGDKIGTGKKDEEKEDYQIEWREFGAQRRSNLLKRKRSWKN